MLLKGILQKTSQGNPTGMTRLRGRPAAGVCEEMEQLEKTVVECLNRLKEDVAKGEAVVASECEHAEQVIESLRADVGVLEAKLKEAQDTVEKKDTASQRMEQTFAAKIVDLLNDIKKKDAYLDSQGNEIKDLKSKLDVQAKQVSQLEHALKQAKAETANETKHAEQIATNSNATIKALEGQVKGAREIIREKDSIIATLEQSHRASIQDLENQIRTKESDLTDRDKEINDLRSEITTLMKRIKEMSSFFRRAEALANLDVQPQTNGAVNSGKEPASRPVALAVASNTTDASGEETIPRSFFDNMTRELSEALGPMAPVILRDHVKAVGESIEKFPKTRVAELIDNVSKEIANENMKIRVREHLDRLHIVKEPLPSDPRLRRPNLLNGSKH